MRFLFLSFAALIIWSAPTAAQTVTGNQLNESCVATGDQNQLFCLAYTIGAWEGIKLGAAQVIIATGARDAQELDQLTSNFLNICVPVTVSNGQIFDVFKLHLQNNPEDRHYPARLILLEAMREKFPCS